MSIGSDLNAAKVTGHIYTKLTPQSATNTRTCSHCFTFTHTHTAMHWSKEQVKMSQPCSPQQDAGTAISMTATSVLPSSAHPARMWLSLGMCSMCPHTVHVWVSWYTLISICHRMLCIVSLSSARQHFAQFCPDANKETETREAFDFVSKWKKEKDVKRNPGAHVLHGFLHRRSKSITETVWL